MSKRLRRSQFLARSAAMLAALSACRLGANGNGTRVIVVGAGVSGLAAAYLLKEAGYDIVVIEGRDRIGGRVWTDRSLGVPVDFGASWIHGDSYFHPIRELAREFGIKTAETDQESYHAYDHNGEKYTDARFATLVGKAERVLEKLEYIVEESEADLSMQAALDLALRNERLSPEELRVLNWLVAMLEAAVASDFSETSAWGDEEEDAFGSDDSLFPGGYDQVLRPIAAPLDIRLNARVTHVQHNNQGVRVETTSGTFEGDAAIITLPLGVLRAGRVAFSPALPGSKQTAIRMLRTGPLNKVVIKFDRDFWPIDRHYLGYVGERKGEYASFLNWRKYTETPLLMCFTAGSVAKENERKSDAQVEREVMAVLRKMFGRETANPTGFKMARWMSDPFAYGSYSVFPPGASGEAYEELARPVGRLFFAGEHTNRSYPATVHGAFLSGVREAERIDAL